MLNRRSALIVVMLFMVGCGDASPPPATSPTTPPAAVSSADAKIEAAIKELPEEDRELAKAQKFCAVEANGRLGSMGKPVKLMLDGQPVFLCCEGCESEAQKDTAATLAKVEKLKAANKN